MSILERIAESDLPTVSPGVSDQVRLVRGGKSVLAPVGQLPVPTAMAEQIAQVQEEQATIDARVAGVEVGQDGLRIRVQAAENVGSQNTTKIGQLEASQGSGIPGYATKADLPATGTANALAMVTNDATAANNGTYRWSGSAWVLSTDRTTQIAADVAAIKVTGELLLNRGADFPQRSAIYNAVNSARSQVLADSLLKVRVVGARRGKFYAIRYFTNGSTELAGSHPWGWAIYEHDAATYATSSASTVVQARTDAAPEIPLSGKPETIEIISTRVPGVSVQITVDTSKLPAWGTSINASTSARAGYSWIIDPSCYDYSTANALESSASKAPALFSINEATRAVSMAWRHDATSLLRTRWEPNGFNSLFNFLGLDRSPATVEVESGTWTTISTSTTDWIPPIALVTDVGDGAGLIYTGGNHGSAGDASGAKTARMVSWDCWVDGAKLVPGQTWGGRATEVVVQWVNELMASNTVTLERYALRQTVVAKFRAGMIEVMIEHTALEPLTIRTDNGLQMRGDAYESSVHFLGGAAQGRQSAELVVDSGAKSVAPEAWAIACRGSYGDQISWLDPAVGLGDHSHVADASPLLRKNASSWKFYQAVVASVNLAMAAGQSYNYRGGYAWSPISLAVGDLDIAFQYRKGSRNMLGWSFSGNGAHSGGAAVLPAAAVGLELLSTGAVVGSSGLPLSSPGYAAPNSELR